MAYFPMFLELKDKDCLIVGGGKVALRKVEVLMDFDAKLTVVAEQICDEIKQYQQKGIACMERSFAPADVEGMECVIAATDDKEVNHCIAEICKQKRIPVNAVDQVEDCTFIFPSYVREGEVVAAFSSGGQSPVITQYLKKEAKQSVTPFLGELANCLGSLRDEAKETIATEKERKQFYRTLLELGLEKHELPTEEEIQKIWDKYRRKTGE